MTTSEVRTMPPPSRDMPRPFATIALFSPEEEQRYLSRWEAIQTMFVDEPRAAVQQADILIGDISDRIATALHQERAALEAHWSRAEQLTTEDFRNSLQRYRGYFKRLLSLDV